MEMASRQDAEDAIVSAQATFKNHLRNMPTFERAGILRRTAEEIRKGSKELIEIVVAEAGKPIRDVTREIGRASTLLDLAADYAMVQQGQVPPMDIVESGVNRTGMAIKVPVGIIVAIVPSNSPVNLTVNKVGPAIAAGNAVIIKPSDQTPLSALWLAAAFKRAGLPDGAINVVIGEVDEAIEPLVRDERVRMVSITGGVPANYGDVTGGIISITTRGPSSVYFGSVEAVSSGIYIKGADKDGYDGKVFGLDKFGYNLFEGMLSGPLWMEKDSTGKKTKPRLGFLISANYTDQLDSRPIKDGGLRIKKDARDALIANPLRPTSTGSGTYHNALFLRNSDFERVDWRMNARSTSLSGQAKIDVNAGANVNLKFGGSFSFNSGPGYSYTGSLLNFQNFGFSKSLDYRVFGQLGQRFNNETPGSSSKIKSALYNIMVDYSHSSSESYDANHKYNLFNYGHIGKFQTNRKPSYEFDPVTNTYIHNGFKDIEVAFTPSESNAALAAITTQYYDIYAGNPTGHYENLFQIQAEIFYK